MKKLNVGIIGLGRIGQEHLRIICEYIACAKVKAVCDVTFNDNSKELMKKYNIRKRYTNHMEMLENTMLDAVYVCTPLETIVPICIDCIKANKHTFAEEGLSKDSSLILNLQNILKKSSVKFFIGFNKRFDHNFNSVRDILFQGKIGDPHIVKITSRDPDFPSLQYLKTSGGLFFDMTIDDFDLIRYLTGAEIEEVFAMGSVLIDEVIRQFNDIDTATLNLRLSSGSLCVIDNSRRALYGFDQRVEIHGSLGMVTTSNELQSKAKIYTGYGVIEEKPRHMILERYRQAYIKESAHFLECIMEDKEPLTTCNDALQALYAAQAAMKSLMEHRPVNISEIK